VAAAEEKRVVAGRTRRSSCRVQGERGAAAVEYRVLLQYVQSSGQVRCAPPAVVSAASH
jgi:hypothetical protein